MSIPNNWKETIKDLINISSKLGKVCNSINTCLSGSYQKPKDVFSYFTPDIFIWDPIAAAAENAYLCPDHMCALRATNTWMDGHDNSRMPRRLIDITGPSYLVGRLYKCELYPHHLRTTDIRVQVERYSKDIVMTHKGSFKNQFLLSLFQGVVNGLSFEKLFDTLKERTLSTFYLNKHKYLLDCENLHQVPDLTNLEKVKEIILDMLPKSDMLEDLFKSWFMENEEMFTECMSSIKAKVLTVDHTFKVWYL